MVYENPFKTDEQGRVLECPICKNTEFSKDAEYCRICGMRRRNYCLSEYEDDQHFAPANARFCEKCGARTFYFEQAILLPWNIQTEKTEFVQVDEEELPF